MRRWLGLIVVAVLWAAPLRADVTITTTTSVEGGMAAQAGATTMTPKVVTRIKGTKSRTDIELQGNSTGVIFDTAGTQVIVLRHDDKSAHLVDPTALATPAPGSGVPPMTLPAIDSTIKPTGQKRTINGVACDEYSIKMLMDMAPMAAGRGDMPPEAAAMLKDLRMTMTGSAWVAKDAPGAAEYRSYQAAATKQGAAVWAAVTRASGGAGMSMPPGMDRLFTGFTEASGIPYLTELTLGVEGNSQIAAMMQKMGAMKVVSRVTDISTDAVADSLFAVPDGYKVIKK